MTNTVAWLHTPLSLYTSLTLWAGGKQLSLWHTEPCSPQGVLGSVTAFVTLHGKRALFMWPRLLRWSGNLGSSRGTQYKRVLEKGGRKVRVRRRCENRSRGQGQREACQCDAAGLKDGGRGRKPRRTQASLEARKGKKMDSPLDSPEGVQPGWHFDLSLGRPILDVWFYLTFLQPFINVFSIVINISPGHIFNACIVFRHIEIA